MKWVAEINATRPKVPSTNQRVNRMGTYEGTAWSTDGDNRRTGMKA
jgi:hypothetical protein